MRRIDNNKLGAKCMAVLTFVHVPIHRKLKVTTEAQMQNSLQHFFQRSCTKYVVDKIWPTLLLASRTQRCKIATIHKATSNVCMHMIHYIYAPK